MKRVLIFTALLLPVCVAAAQAKPTAKVHQPAAVRKAASIVLRAVPTPQAFTTLRSLSSAPMAAPAARDTPFPDVPKDHWAYQSVETLRRAGIVHGSATPAPASK